MATISDDALLHVLEYGGLVVSGIVAQVSNDWRRIALAARSHWLLCGMPAPVWNDFQQCAYRDSGLKTMDLMPLPGGGMALLQSSETLNRFCFFTPELTLQHRLVTHRSGLPGDWSLPTASVCDNSHLYTAEADDRLGTHRVQQFRMQQIDLSPHPRPAVVGSDGFALLGPEGVGGGSTSTSSSCEQPHHARLHFVSSAPLPRATGGNLFSYVGGGHFGGPAEGQLNRPTSLALSSDGASLLFVVDSTNHRIALFSTRPTLEWTGNIGGPRPGHGANEFNTPLHAIIHGEELFVCDSGNHRVVVVDCKTLMHLRVIGRKGTGPGQFNHPFRLAVCTDRLCTLDAPHRTASRVQILTFSGVPMQSLPCEREYVAMCPLHSASALLLASQGSAIDRIDICPDGSPANLRALPTAGACVKALDHASRSRKSRRGLKLKMLRLMPTWMQGTLVALCVVLFAMSLS